ncbi:hypothetical protein IV203_032352 [Nitzschia inconspicua]|uniref:SET domain-containing protein n=1 Tax=Nitzschia inconspicua TaxID=303405 RepID=A0A9K3KK72_9STRA|nr:hypothetical protein IV203_032352 [Nitzschia inconspicua]
MMSWFFGNKNYSPPSITGCSAINITHLESFEETYTTIQKAFDLAKGEPHNKYGHSYTGIQVDFDVVSDHKAVMGNALIAKQYVPQGTTVWEDWHYVRFSVSNPKKYYRFLENLDLKHQCLVLSLTHASYDGYYLEVTMDEGNYIQNAEHPEQINLDTTCVATRDIAAGERFYMNFTEYIGYDHEIDWFDDLKYEAFRDGKLRGGSTSPSAAISWSDRPMHQTSRTLADRINGYPAMFWPALTILAAMFALKKAAATSRQDGFNKTKLC